MAYSIQTYQDLLFVWKLSMLIHLISMQTIFCL